MQASRGTRGFTLLELILSLAVMCLLAMTLYASLRTAFKAQEVTTAAVERMRGGQVAMQIMARDLACALPPPSSTSASSTMMGPFYGVPLGAGSDVGDMVEFYAVTGGTSDSDDPTRADGIKRIDFTLEPDTDGTKCLVRRVQRNLLATEEMAPDEETLCRHVKALTMRYFDGQQWQDSWDSTAVQDTLPVAVEITLELEPGAKETVGYKMVRTVYLPGTVPTNITGGTTS